MLEDSTHGTIGVTLPLFPATYASHLLSSSCVSDKLGVLWLSDALRLVLGKSSSTAQGKWLQPSFQRHSSIVVDICYLPFYLRIFNHKERNFPHTLQCSLSLSGTLEGNSPVITRVQPFFCLLPNLLLLKLRTWFYIGSHSHSALRTAKLLTVLGFKEESSLLTWL